MCVCVCVCVRACMRVRKRVCVCLQRHTVAVRSVGEGLGGLMEGAWGSLE